MAAVCLSLTLRITPICVRETRVVAMNRKLAKSSAADTTLALWSRVARNPDSDKHLAPINNMLIKTPAGAEAINAHRRDRPRIEQTYRLGQENRLSVKDAQVQTLELAQGIFSL